MSRARIGEWCVTAGLQLLFWHTRHSPWFLRLFRPTILAGAWALAPSTRRATLANAARLLGPASGERERKSTARAVLRNYFDAVIEFGANRAVSPRELAASLELVEGIEGYTRAREVGLGAILVTAHMGPFESAMAMLRTREPRVHVVFRRDRMPLFEQLRSAQHARLGVIEAPAENGLMTWVRLRDALGRNEVVVMQGDRVMPGQPGVRVPMLGGHVVVPAGPVKLARITGSPVVPVFAVRAAGGGIRIHLEEAIWPNRLGQWPIGARGIDPAIGELKDVIERFVRHYPEQWLCLHTVVIEDAADAAAERVPA